MTVIEEQPVAVDGPHCPTCTCGNHVKNPVAPKSIDHGFDHFWAVYPRRQGMPKGHKGQTLDKWKKLNLDDRILAWRAATKLAAIVAAGITLPKDSQRFLTLGRDYWRDLLESHPEVARPSWVPQSAVPDGNGGWLV